jgi:hypothetical protein
LSQAPSSSTSTQSSSSQSKATPLASSTSTSSQSEVSDSHSAKIPTPNPASAPALYLSASSSGTSARRLSTTNAPAAISTPSPSGSSESQSHTGQSHHPQDIAPIPKRPNQDMTPIPKHPKDEPSSPTLLSHPSSSATSNIVGTSDSKRKRYSEDEEKPSIITATKKVKLEPKSEESSVGAALSQITTSKSDNESLRWSYVSSSKEAAGATLPPQVQGSLSLAASMIFGTRSVATPTPAPAAAAVRVGGASGAASNDSSTVTKPPSPFGQREAFGSSLFGSSFSYRTAPPSTSTTNHTAATPTAGTAASASSNTPAIFGFGARQPSYSFGSFDGPLAPAPDTNSFFRSSSPFAYALRVTSAAIQPSAGPASGTSNSSFSAIGP